MEFEKLNLNKSVIDILKNLGYTYPTEVQQKTIPVVLNNCDVIVRSETGSGKTFSFVLPILQKIDRSIDNIQCLVLCPTRELAIQVADETKKIAEPLNIKICAVFGGSSIERQTKSLKSHPQFVVGTTGRVIDLIKRKALKIENLDYIVLDEADEMLDMGFRPDIEMIMGHTKKRKQVLMFSATMPSEIKELATKYQQNPVFIEIGKENNAISTISQSYIYVNKNQKKQALLELFYSDIYKKTIVFVNTKIFAEDIEHFLNKNNIKAKALHGDMRQNERRRVLTEFKSDKLDIIVATDVAARGLDIKGVDYVINFDLPHELEFYVHRIGRTARAGANGNVINLITSPEQFSKMRDIEKATSAKIDLYKTESENLKQYFVDTKKLAKKKFKQQVFVKHNLKNRNTRNADSAKKSFKDDFLNNMTFKRFATFDYFDEFYNEQENIKMSKKSKRNSKDQTTALKQSKFKVNTHDNFKKSKYDIFKNNKNKKNKKR